MAYHTAYDLKKPFLFVFILLLIFSLVLGACSTLGASSGVGEEDAPASEEGGEDPAGGQEGGDQGSDPSEGEQAESGDDIPPVWTHCPAEPMEISMFIYHTWNFSPNRETDKMSVEGSTGALASCSLTVHKNNVSMEDCVIPITNSGFIQTDAGKCDITSSGYAVISLSEGSCQDGVITLSISEDLDPDAGYEGAMNCPKTSQPYIPFYPPSLTTREFPIQTGGMSATESVDPDLSGQFRYDKEWTLVSEELALPETEE